MRWICALLLASTVGLGACANSKEAEDQSDAEPGTATATSPFEAAEAARDAAPWMPADTFALGAAETTSGFAWLEQIMPRSEDVESGAPGTVEALKSDLRTLYRDELGLDPTEIDSFVLGAGRAWQTLVLYGQLDPSDDLEAVEIEEQKVLKVPLEFSREVRRTLGRHVWAVPFDDPRPGLAMFRTKKNVTDALGARNSDDSDAETLAESGFDRFSDTFDTVDTGRIGFTVLLERLDELQMMAGRLPVPLPDRIVAGYGDELAVGALGSQETLDSIRKFVDKQRDRADKILGTLKNKADSQPTARAAGILSGYHLGKAYLRVLEPQKTDGALTYSVDPPTGMASMATIGVLSAIAIPAFMKYLQRSKSAESEQTMKKMTDGAKSYFTSEQKVTPKDGVEPWHSGGTNGMPVPFDKYVFPGGTNVKLVTTTETPSGGQKYMPEPKLVDAPDGVTVEAVLAKLNVSFDEPMYFKYVYETGAGSGPDATATVKAVHDFDEASRAVHTVTQKLGIDEDQRVQIVPAFTENEFE